MTGQLHAHAALPTGERAPGTHWIGGWVGPRTGLDAMQRRKILPSPGLELRPLDRPASRYTDCAIQAHVSCEVRTEFLNTIYIYQKDEQALRGYLPPPLPPHVMSRNTPQLSLLSFCFRLQRDKENHP
jgi:hypothetical protein